MRSLSFLLMIAAVMFMGMAEVRAAGGCPESADRLEDFAGCLMPVQGGARYRGTMANLDRDHQMLLAAMERNPGVPPQVMPPGVPAYGPNPWVTFNYAMWNAAGYVAASYGRNPAFWWTMGFPVVYR